MAQVKPTNKMRSRFRQLKRIYREHFQQKFKFHSQLTTQFSKLQSCNSVTSHKTLIPIINLQARNAEFLFLGRIETAQLVHSLANSDEKSEFQRYPGDEIAINVQNILKTCSVSTKGETEKALNQCELTLTDDLIVNVINRYRFDWEAAYTFFKCVSREGDYSPGSNVFNAILDVLGRARRFVELIQVFDEMPELMNEKTYGILLNRYAAAHMVEEAIGVFDRRKEFGELDDLSAFQNLLLWLCRYKHVEVAETFFESKKNEFGYDIKTMNIILNGWCVLGNVYEAKRFWKDIIKSKCEPDSVTYATFVNALTKKGKLGTALRLFQAMWEKGRKPDVVTCNCIIDALCFKKRIPEALEVLREMKNRGCLPNVTTYNSLIKHLCKIKRMETVYEYLDEMEQKNGSCLPNEITFNYLLKSLKKPEEVPWVLEKMERNGCKMSTDTYNVILKLYVNWDCEDKVRHTWEEMEKKGMGPDQRSYTVMIHGLYDKGRLEDALSYFHEMRLKGMVPEPRTGILVNDMNIKLKERGAGQKGDKTHKSRTKRECMKEKGR